MSQCQSHRKNALSHDGTLNMSDMICVFVYKYVSDAIAQYVLFECVYTLRGHTVSPLLFLI